MFDSRIIEDSWYYENIGSYLFEISKYNKNGYFWWSFIFGIPWTIFWSGIGLITVNKPLGALATIIGIALMAVFMFED